jgi:hypothetical protein
LNDGLPHEFDPETEMCVYCGLKEHHNDNEIDANLCEATAVDELELTQRKDNLAVHLAYGIANSTALQAVDFTFGHNGDLTWQQKQLLLSALSRGSNTQLGNVSSNGNPIGVDVVIEAKYYTQDHKTSYARILSAQTPEDDAERALFRGQETCDKIENALAAKLCISRLAALSNK